MPYYLKLGEYYHTINTEYELAEKYYVKSGNALKAVNMYMKLKRWDDGHKVAMGHLKDKEIYSFYLKFARELEAEKQYKEAEKAYLMINESGLAIKMYKNQKNFRY